MATKQEHAICDAILEELERHPMSRYQFAKILPLHPSAVYRFFDRGGGNTRTAEMMMEALGLRIVPRDTGFTEPGSNGDRDQ